MDFPQRVKSFTVNSASTSICVTGHNLYTMHKLMLVGLIAGVFLFFFNKLMRSNMPQSRNELLKIMHSNINPWTDEDNNENLITKVQLIYFMEPVFNI